MEVGVYGMAAAESSRASRRAETSGLRLTRRRSIGVCKSETKICSRREMHSKIGDHDCHAVDSKTINVEDIVQITAQFDIIRS